jgi:hypothetical protein
MLDKRVEALVLGNDVEVGVRIGRREPAYVISNVEIQGIGSVAADLDITAIGTQRLDGIDYWEVETLLIWTDKDHNPKMLMLELFNGLRLHIL